MAPDIPFRFTPTQKGLTKLFGPLEAEIMELLWVAQRSTVRAVYKQLLQRRDLAYTTVMTTMSRLAEKGFLIQEPATKRRPYNYTPALSREAFATMVVRQTLDSLLDDYPDLVVDHMRGYLEQPVLGSR